MITPPSLPCGTSGVERLVAERDDWRAEVAEREAEAFRERAVERSADRAAPQALASILGRIADSAVVQR